MLKSFNSTPFYHILWIFFSIIYFIAAQSSCIDKAYTKQDLKDYHIKCSEDNPTLFLREQCSPHACVCVDPNSGIILNGSTHRINSFYNCFSKLVKWDIGIPRDQMIKQLPQIFNKNQNNIPNTDVLIAQKAKIMNEVISNSLYYVLNKTLGLKYSIDKIQRIDSPSVDGLFSYYTIRIFLYGSEREVNTSLEKIRQEMQSGFLDSIKINNNFSRVEFQENEKNLALKNLEIGNEKKKQKSLSVQGAEPAQSDFPNDLDESLGFQTNKSPSDFDNENYDAKMKEKSFWQKNIDFVLNQPGILAGFIGALLTAVLLFILLLVFCIYRLRKKDEGSYTLDEAKKVQINPAYTRAPTREFYA